MSYRFRNTFRQDASTFVEDRGYPFTVAEGDELYGTLLAEFGGLLEPGQTAVHDASGDGWDVVDGFPLLEDARVRRLAELRKAWLGAEASGTVTMNGVAYDCNDRANRDIAGLIASMEASGAETVQFCAADNSFHALTLADLKALQLLVVGRAQALYAHKWELRTELEAAESFDELNAVEISFEGV